MSDRRTWLCGLCARVAAWVIVMANLGAGFAADSVRAGAAVTDVTPPLGYPMWGYAARHDAPSVGVLSPLKARAVVITDGSKKLAVVSLDLGRAPARDSTARIRAAAAEFGVGAIFLVASHTHHGPVLELHTWPSPERPYTRELELKLIDVIRRADADARPAKLGVHARRVSYNRNRQSRRPDAPLDDEFVVLGITDESGRAIVTLVNFAAHPTMTAANDRRMSADFPGALAATVEAATGAPCLFLQGAAGDLATQAPMNVKGPIAFGELLGSEVLQSLKLTQPLPAKLPIQSSSDAMAFRCQINVTDPFVKVALGRVFFPELVAFYEREYADGVRPELTAAVLGDSVGMVGFSGEMFCGHAIRLRQRARLPVLMVFGYCNDYQQYFPTIEATAEGGYGAGLPVAVTEVGAGERLADRALVRLYQLHGRLP